MTAHFSPSPGVRHVMGVVIGVIGTVIAFLLVGDALTGSEPVGVVRPPAASAVTALQMLGGGAALGVVLLAGRALSPWAPLASGLLWGLGALASLADPQGVAVALPQAAVILSGHQLGLGLTGLMILGAVALKPRRVGTASPAASARSGADPYPTDPHLGPVRAGIPAAARPIARVVPRRYDGPGPRHRAGPSGWTPPVALPRGPGARRRSY